MNNVLSHLEATRAGSGDDRELSSYSMLAELLALYEDMLLQLRAERPNPFNTVFFLESMIRQHQRAARDIREKLGHLERRAAEARQAG